MDFAASRSGVLTVATGDLGSRGELEDGEPLHLMEVSDAPAKDFSRPKSTESIVIRCDGS